MAAASPKAMVMNGDFVCHFLRRAFCTAFIFWRARLMTEAIRAAVPVRMLPVATHQGRFVFDPGTEVAALVVFGGGTSGGVRP
jgi:hypothetical protein